MNRRDGGWDQNVWLGISKKESKKDPKEAWNRLPPLLKAALVWAFLKNGPNTVRDLARLHDGLCFGARGPISLAVREEPRWMAENLLRLLPTLSASQAEAAISIFMSPMKPGSVKNRRLKEGEKSSKQDTWGMARRGEEGLQPFEAEDYQRWLPIAPPNREDFIIWLHEALDFYNLYEKQRQRSIRKNDQNIPTPPIPNGLYENGRRFPVDMGEWWLVKQLIDSNSGLQWGYQLWRTNGTLAKSQYMIYNNELQRGAYPNGGLLASRADRNAFIGGPGRGLKNFKTMINDALDALVQVSADMHVKALVCDLDMAELRRRAIGAIPFLLGNWWKGIGPTFRSRQLRAVLRNPGKAHYSVQEFVIKLSN